MTPTLYRWLGATLLAFAAALVVVAATRAHAAPPPAPTFTKDVAPILFANCATCHHDGGSGPFALVTFEDAKKRARLIASVTQSRYMPPWLPAPGHGDFADERTLSAEQIRTIQRWVDAGSVEGPSEDLPPVPHFPDGWLLGTPDLVIEMPEAYALRADGPDVFRNFVFPVSIPATRFVRAIEILPGDQGSSTTRMSLSIGRGARGVATRRIRVSALAEWTSR